MPKIIMAVARIPAVARIMAVVRITPVARARITAVLGRMDGRITAVARTDPVPVQGTPVTQAPSRSRLAIDRITRTAPGITLGGPITSGDRDIGQTAAVEESGSAATTLCEDNRSVATRSRLMPQTGVAPVIR